MIDAGFEILNQRGTPMFFSDTFANRPAAGIVGRIFISTDTNEIFRDTGSGWNLLGGGGGTIGGSIIAGQVAFGTASNTIGGSNALQWDNTNERLGVGVGVPTSKLHLFGIAPVINSSTNVSNQFHGLELSEGTSLDSFFKQRPDTGELRISNGRTTIWNGFITFYTDTTEKMRITPLGRLLLNTTTDTGERLQVNGTSSFLGNITLGLNQNAATGFTITNTTSGTAANSFLKLQTTNASTYGEFAKLSASYTTYKIFVGNDLAIYNTNTSGDIAILNDFATGNIKFSAGGSSTAQMTLLNNGNLGIGIASPAQALSIIRNENTTSGIETQNTSTGAAANSGIIVRNSATSGQLFKLGTGYTTYKTLVASDLGFYNAGAGDITLLNEVVSGKIKFLAGNSATTAQMTLTANGRLLLGSTTESTQTLQVTGDTRITGATIIETSLGFGTDSSRATIFASGTNSRGITIKDNAAGTASYATLTIGDQTKTSTAKPDLLLNSSFSTSNINFVFNKLELTGTYTEVVGGSATRGLYINTTIGATNNYRAIEWSNNNGFGLYGAGTANNYLAGSLGIGSTTNLTSRNLSIIKNITGNTTSYSVVNDSFVQSDVTSNATGFYNGINTQNTTFTLGNYMHFDAQQGTIGASSTITNQYGFRAASGLIGATNNFGFRGDIPSGTGRWNIYMNGTALNYMAGALLLGSATSTGEQLQITGTQINTDARTYSTGSIQSVRLVKNLTIPSGSTISSTNSIFTLIGTGTTTFQGSVSIPNSTPFATGYLANVYNITAAATTITSDQAAGGIRSLSQLNLSNYFGGTNSGTLTHVSTLQLAGFYNNNSGSITPTITNAYQLLINSIDDYGHTFTYTNRWAIYQEGLNDRNYLNGKLLIGSTSDTGEKVQITGSIRVNGQLSGSAGGNSGTHLIIYCDGTQYKIALLNP